MVQTPGYWYQQIPWANGKHSSVSDGIELSVSASQIRISALTDLTNFRGIKITIEYTCTDR
jgi:hypothetical protein